MAWQHGHYYRKKWVDGTCVSEHVGTGTLGELAEQLDRAERVKRKAKAELHRRAVEADKAIVDDIRQIGAIVRDMTKLVLLVEGYHTHRRQWRRDSSVTDEIVVPVKQTAALDIPASELNALIRRVDSSNPTAEDRQQLSKYLAAVPNLASALGGMASQAAVEMINRMHNSASARLAAGAHLIHMQNELGYDDANPLERGLIHNIVICWFRLNYAEHMVNLNATGQHDVKVGRYWDGRLSAAQRRYLRAVESLARVRKLLRPDSPTVAIMNNVAVGSDR